MKQRRWKVGIVSACSKPRFSCGWDKFVYENNLAVDDKLRFEMMEKDDSIFFDVHVLWTVVLMQLYSWSCMSTILPLDYFILRFLNQIQDRNVLWYYKSSFFKYIILYDCSHFIQCFCTYFFVQYWVCHYNIISIYNWFSKLHI